MLSIFHISSHLSFKTLNYYYHFKAKKTLRELKEVVQIHTVKQMAESVSFLILWLHS